MPQVVDDFPRRVRELEPLWIPLPDGARLAARAWIPEDAEQSPVPAIVEYLPYRKRDGTRWRDELMHPYFAGHGYASIRIDVRGAGESDGVLQDEYHPTELADGVAAIRWLASRPWCTGAVGMLGKSWGGFNALQIAALRPPELRAVITCCSTDDRYADDAHYMGGCLLTENLLWGAHLFTISALPPDPQLVGPSWRATWTDRLEQLSLNAATWLRHPWRDDYWKHGSVCEDYAAIRCPVFVVGGWADAYTNAVPRLLRGLDVPRRALVGPWAHVYPHRGGPGPAIGFLQEALRWWDRWLKGRPDEGSREPLARVWLQEGPGQGADRPGRWIDAEGWSGAAGPRLRLFPGRGLLAAAPTAGEPVELTPAPASASGAWCSFGLPGDLPGDQRHDDAQGCAFETEPLTERLVVLGAPLLRLSLSADQPCAQVAARLCEVTPDGRSARVSYGLLNLTHRDGHERPSPLVPGVTCEVELQLNHLAHAFLPGNRVRLVLTAGYWPIAWPAPRPTRLRLVPGPATSLELPLHAIDPARPSLPELPPPETAPPLESEDVSEGRSQRRVWHDAEQRELVHSATVDLDPEGRPALEHLTAIDLIWGHSVEDELRVREDDPSSARAWVKHQVVLQRAGWEVSVTTETRLSSTPTEFLLEARLEARSSSLERPVLRTWSERIERRLL